MARPIPDANVAFNDNAPPKVSVERFLEMSRLGQIENVRQTLKTQPEIIDQKDRMGNTALIEAYYSKHHDVIDVLLAAGADVNKQNRATFSPLILAIMEHDLKSVTKFLEHKANADTQVDRDIYALMLAALQGDDAIVEKLLEHGAAKELKDERGDTAAMHAIHNGQQSTLRILKKAGANINARNKVGDSGLDHTIYIKRNDAMFDTLIELGADFLTGNKISTDPVKSNTTPAMWAASADNTYALKKLKDLGAPVDTWNGHGMTPIIFSAVNGAYGTAQQLVEWEVSLLSPYPERHSARRHAELKGHDKIVRLFDLMNGKKVAQAVSSAQLRDSVEAPQKAAFKKRVRTVG